MQVISINDFERAQELQLEYIMEGAVDHLEQLSQPPNKRPTIADVVVHFGQLRLDEDLLQYRFDFEPPTTCRQWPGPRYGPYSLHKPLPTMPRNKAKSKGSKQSKKHARPDDLKQSLRPLKAPKPKKTRKVDVAPVLLTAKTSRDPPLHLMALPPELRNVIWSLLAVHDEPIEAQLRPIRPYKRPTKLNGTIIRRFPIEPVVARVSQQVRREVLSIFYGDNHFIFQKNACAMFKGHHMTDPSAMQRWKPRREAAKYLTHLDIRFNALPRTFRSTMIVYTLRKLSDGSVTIKVKAEKGVGKEVAANLQPCLCSEENVASVMKGKHCKGELVEVAMLLTKSRNVVLFSTVQERKTTLYHPAQRTCEKCERDTFDTVYST